MFHLSWATTIYYIQGDTIETPIIIYPADFKLKHNGHVIPYAMYVATSRVRDLDKLFLAHPLIPQHLAIDMTVKDFMDNQMWNVLPPRQQMNVDISSWGIRNFNYTQVSSYAHKQKTGECPVVLENFEIPLLLTCEKHKQPFVINAFVHNGKIKHTIKCNSNETCYYLLEEIESVSGSIHDGNGIIHFGYCRKHHHICKISVIVSKSILFHKLYHGDCQYTFHVSTMAWKKNEN